MSYKKKTLMLMLIISVFCLFASFASAEVVYKDGTARIQGATHSLKHITNTYYLEIKHNISENRGRDNNLIWTVTPQR